jgi:hypothetical protein
VKYSNVGEIEDEAKSLDKIKAKVAEMESKKIHDNLMKVLMDFSQLD